MQGRSLGGVELEFVDCFDQNWIDKNFIAFQLLYNFLKIKSSIKIKTFSGLIKDRLTNIFLSTSLSTNLNTNKLQGLWLLFHVLRRNTRSTEIAFSCVIAPQNVFCDTVYRWEATDTCQTRILLSEYPANRVCPSVDQARDRHCGGSALEFWETTSGRSSSMVFLLARS